MQQTMHEHLSHSDAETGAMAVIIDNYKKNGDKFLNLLHIYPWMRQSNRKGRRRSLKVEQNSKRAGSYIEDNVAVGEEGGAYLPSFNRLRSSVNDTALGKSSEGSLYQWIWVLHDVTPASDIYKVKPVLQQLLECTRNLLGILKDGHAVLLELFGKVTQT